MGSIPILVAMNSKQKILDVLTRIKSESEINAEPDRMRFHFNHNVVGAGILSADEEIRILAKLQKNNWVRLGLPTDDEGIVTSNTPEDYMSNRDDVLVELLQGFKLKYKFYKLASYPTENNWNYVNPIWWLWILLSSLWNLLNTLGKVIFQHWLISLTFGILGLLAIDYTLAWQNALMILNFFK